MHVACISVYAGGALQFTADLEEKIQHAFIQGNFEMVGIVDITDAEEGVGFDVMVDWVGIKKEKSSCKQRPLGISRLVCSRLERKHEINH